MGGEEEDVDDSDLTIGGEDVSPFEGEDGPLLLLFVLLPFESFEGVFCCVIRSVLRNLALRF